MGKYIYDIFDVIENDFVIVNAGAAEVTEIIGMPYGVMHTYSKHGTVYDGRYLLTKREDKEGIVKKNTNSLPPSLLLEFEKVAKEIRSKVGPDRLRKIKIKKLLDYEY